MTPYLSDGNHLLDASLLRRIFGSGVRTNPEDAGVSHVLSRLFLHCRLTQTDFSRTFKPNTSDAIRAGPADNVSAELLAICPGLSRLCRTSGAFVRLHELRAMWMGTVR